MTQFNDMALRYSSILVLFILLACGFFGYIMLYDLVYNKSKAPTGKASFSFSTTHRRLLNPEMELKKGVTEGMQVLVVSHGGVGTNSFASYIEKHGLKVMTQSWHGYLCHAHRPTDGTGLKLAVYLYGDPLLSICSMKSQGNAKLNLWKLTNDGTNAPQNFDNYTDSALLQAIYSQFKSFATRRAKGYPTLLLRYEDTFNPFCLNKIKTILGLSGYMNHRTFVRRKTSDRSKCIQSLSISPKLKNLVDQMNNHQSDCRK